MNEERTGRRNENPLGFCPQCGMPLMNQGVPPIRICPRCEPLNAEKTGKVAQAIDDPGAAGMKRIRNGAGFEEWVDANYKLKAGEVVVDAGAPSPSAPETPVAAQGRPVIAPPKSAGPLPWVTVTLDEDDALKLCKLLNKLKTKKVADLKIIIKVQEQVGQSLRGIIR